LQAAITAERNGARSYAEYAPSIANYAPEPVGIAASAGRVLRPIKTMASSTGEGQP
jgi:hypothetical protein